MCIDWRCAKNSMQNLAYWFFCSAGFFFLYCFSAGRNIRFKVKLNQSCSHTRNAISILGNQHRVCELCIRVQLVLLRSFQADKMAQMHHIKQWINAIFVAKIVLLFIAIQVVNVPTTSNMVNMGFGFFSLCHLLFLYISKYSLSESLVDIIKNPLE